MKDSIKVLHMLLLFLLATNEVCFGNNTKNQLKLTVTLDQIHHNDTLVLELVDQWVLKKTAEVNSTVDANGRFVFNVKSENTDGFWQLKILPGKHNTLLSKEVSVSKLFYWENGDEINLDLRFDPAKLYRNSLYRFTGTGAEKYQLAAYLFATDSVQTKFDSPERKYSYFTSDFIYHQQPNPLTDFRLRELRSKKAILSVKSYAILEQEILCDTENAVFFSQITSLLNSQDSHALPDDYKKNYFRSTQNIWPFSNEIGVLNSYKCIKRLQQKIFRDILVNNYPAQNELPFYYDYVKNNVKGELRERLIIDYFNNYVQPQSFDSLLLDAVFFFKTEQGLRNLKDLSAPKHQNIGAGYTFIDQHAKQLSLDSLKGKVILFDIYFSGCASCITLYQNVISKIKKKFENNPDFVILSLSVDKNFDVWQRTLKKGLYTSFSSNTINLYTGSLGRKHPFIVDNNIVYNPSLILIDKQGKTRYINNQILFELVTLEKAIRELL